MISTGELAERQIDVESDGVEAEVEGEGEVLDEVARQDTSSTSSLGNLGKINMSRKGNLIKNWEELSVTHLKPGQGSDEKADCEIAEKDDGHLAVEVISQAFLETVRSQRHDKEHNAEKRNGILIIEGLSAHLMMIATGWKSLVNSVHQLYGSEEENIAEQLNPIFFSRCCLNISRSPVS